MLQQTAKSYTRGERQREKRAAKRAEKRLQDWSKFLDNAEEHLRIFMESNVEISLDPFNIPILPSCPTISQREQVFWSN